MNTRIAVIAGEQGHLLDVVFHVMAH